MRPATAHRDAPAALERELRDWLAQRRAALDLEVRQYPTPIARCDVQLPALLDARAAVVRLLAVDDPRELAAGFVALTADADDAAAARLRALASRV